MHVHRLMIDTEALALIAIDEFTEELETATGERIKTALVGRIAGESGKISQLVSDGRDELIEFARKRETVIASFLGILIGIFSALALTSIFEPQHTPALTHGNFLIVWISVWAAVISALLYFYFFGGFEIRRTFQGERRPLKFDLMTFLKTGDSLADPERIRFRIDSLLGRSAIREKLAKYPLLLGATLLRDHLLEARLKVLHVTQVEFEELDQPQCIGHLTLRPSFWQYFKGELENNIRVDLFNLGMTLAVAYRNSQAYLWDIGHATWEAKGAIFVSEFMRLDIHSLIEKLGKQIIAGSQPTPLPQSPSSQASTIPILRCPYCGTEVRFDSTLGGRQFCDTCGSLLSFSFENVRSDEPLEKGGGDLNSSEF